MFQGMFMLCYATYARYHSYFTSSKVCWTQISTEIETAFSTPLHPLFMFFFACIHQMSLLYCDIFENGSLCLMFTSGTRVDDHEMRK